MYELARFLKEDADALGVFQHAAVKVDVAALRD